MSLDHCKRLNRQPLHVGFPARRWSQIQAAIVNPLVGCAKGELPWPLLLFGGVGAGKTCAALLMHDWTAVACYMPFARLHERIVLARKGELVDGRLIHTPPMSESDYWQRFAQYNLVTLDEIGTGTATATATDALREALNVRECKPLILISNMTPDELVGLYDDRVVSRMTAGTVVHVDGPDRRQG